MRATSPRALHAAAADAAFAELASLSDDEEFVAIPDPEPVEGEDNAVAETLPSIADEPIPEPVDEVTAVDETVTESTDELPLETTDVVSAVDELPLESNDEPATTATAETRPEFLPTANLDMLGGDDDHSNEPDSAGPPMFGFDFGAGSFLGGMPLSLQSTAPPPRPLGNEAYAFQELNPHAPPREQTESMHAEFEPAADVSPQSPSPSMTAPAALVDMDESSLISFDDPGTPMGGVVNSDGPLTTFDPPIELPHSTQSSDDQTLTSTTSRPAINTLADEVAIPPLVGITAETKAPTRQSLTTAFDGLAGGLGAAAMNVDVFSQMAPPINDELFGSRGDKPEDVVLPDKQPEIPPAAPRRDPPPHIPPIDRVGPARPGTPAAAAAAAGAAEVNREEQDDRPERDYHRNPPDRFARLPTLALLMLLCLIAAGMMIYFFLPPPIDVVGTLTFENLSKQPVSSQRQFYINQTQRLESPDVRNVARSIASSKSVGTGFLDDDLEFAKVTANADWDGDVMTIHQTATDEYAARTRLMALLEALARKDADLNDALASARAAAATAHDAVAAQQQVISRIRADRETQVRIGDSAPRLEDVAVIERKANQLDAAWVAAKTQRADAQLILDKLRQMDPTTSADPKDDPLLAELRTHQQEADVRLAVARATAVRPSATQPSPEVDMGALAADVNQTRAAIDKRLAQLQAEKTQTPEQRIASRQAAIESQSVKLATLQAAETDAAAAAQSAAIAARDQRCAA